jgi:prolyl-tRNA synthetase
MESSGFITNVEETEQWLTNNGVEFTTVTHEAVATVEAMVNEVKFTHAEVMLAKNLFLKDKKKKTLYLVVVKHDAKVDMKALAKHLKTGSSNIRGAEADKMEETLKVLPGSVNLFSIVNDKAGLVSLIVDKALTEASHVGFHPMLNVATTAITQEGLQKVISASGHTADVVDFEAIASVSASAPAAETGKAAKKPKPVKEAKKKVVAKEEDTHLLGITVDKEEDFSSWYTQVITKSEMIEYYDVSGCYILRPWSYSIWERVQGFLDAKFKESDVENVYFPMFVTQKALAKEASHIEGFAPEVAWVTKSGDTDLPDPIAIRPTSETIMYPAFAKWVHSHRDLPVLYNQWTNVVRWELKHPTPFIRTREFLWQEGHTAHSTKKEATEMVYDIMEYYALCYEEMYAVPVIRGVKSREETFAGADFTSTVELFVPANGRGIQGATSHFLGQNFSKMFDIEFEDESQKKEHAFQTSWGFSTRSIGSMIMIHGDSKGLVLPPRIAQVQVVIVPIFHKDHHDKIQETANELFKTLKSNKIRVKLDDRSNYNPGWKFNHWEVKGVPIRIEIGAKDIQKEEVRVVRRFDGLKYQQSTNTLVEKLHTELEDIQKTMYENALKTRDSRLKKADTWADFMTELNQRNIVETPWCDNQECECKIKDKSAEESKAAESEGEELLTGSAKTLCKPLKQEPLGEDAKCFHCGEKAVIRAVWGRSY